MGKGMRKELHVTQDAPQVVEASQRENYHLAPNAVSFATRCFDRHAEAGSDAVPRGARVSA